MRSQSVQTSVCCQPQKIDDTGLDRSSYRKLMEEV